MRPNRFRQNSGAVMVRPCMLRTRTNSVTATKPYRVMCRAAEISPVCRTTSGVKLSVVTQCEITTPRKRRTRVRSAVRARSALAARGGATCTAVVSMVGTTLLLHGAARLHPEFVQLAVRSYTR